MGKKKKQGMQDMQDKNELLLIPLKNKLLLTSCLSCSSCYFSFSTRSRRGAKTQRRTKKSHNYLPNIKKKLLATSAPPRLCASALKKNLINEMGSK